MTLCVCIAASKSTRLFASSLSACFWIFIIIVLERKLHVASYYRTTCFKNINFRENYNNMNI